MIKKDGDKFILHTKDGSKKLGTFSSHKKAKLRERQIKYFKTHAEALESTLAEELGYLSGLSAHDGTQPSFETIILAVQNALEDMWDEDYQLGDTSRASEPMPPSGMDGMRPAGQSIPMCRYKVVGVFPASLVYCDEDGKLWRQSYTMAGSEATIADDAVEVTAEFPPLQDQTQQESTDLIEARPAGSIQDAKLNRSTNVIEGTVLITPISSNGINRKRQYSEKALRKIASMAEGMPAYANHVAPDLAFKPRDVKELIGRHQNVRYDAASGKVYSDLHVLRHQAPWVFSLAEKMGDVVGNSLVSKGVVRMEGDTEMVDDIVQLRSGDLVSDPATTRGLFEAQDEVGRPAYRVGIQAGHIDLQESKEEPVIMELTEIIAHLKGKPDQSTLLAAHLGFLPKADADTLSESVKTLTGEKTALTAQVATLTTDKDAAIKSLSEAKVQLDAHDAKAKMAEKRDRLIKVISEHDLGKQFGKTEGAVSDKFVGLMEGADEAKWGELLDDRLGVFKAGQGTSKDQKPVSTLSEHRAILDMKPGQNGVLPDGIFHQAARAIGG